MLVTFDASRYPEPAQVQNLPNHMTVRLHPPTRGESRFASSFTYCGTVICTYNTDANVSRIRKTDESPPKVSVYDVFQYLFGINPRNT